MKNKGLRNLIALLITALLIALMVIFNEFFIYTFSALALKSARSYLPDKGITMPTFVSTTAEYSEAEPTTRETTTEKAVSATVKKDENFTDTPEDIKKIIAEREKTAPKDKKDGTIYEKQYKNEGVTDSFGLVKVKNVNKTDIDIEAILGEKIDLSVSGNKPSVLIFHTHTTETYQILDRGFYETNFATRTKESGKNMIRVGAEICQ